MDPLLSLLIDFGVLFLLFQMLDTDLQSVPILRLDGIPVAPFLCVEKTWSG